MEKQARRERHNKVLSFYNQGKTYQEISELVGMSKSGVHKVINSILNHTDVSNKVESKINVKSLRDIAIYLEGIKHGKGDLLPLGNIVLDDLWGAIKILNEKVKNDSEKSTASGNDDK